MIGAGCGFTTVYIEPGSTMFHCNNIILPGPLIWISLYTKHFHMTRILTSICTCTCMRWRYSTCCCNVHHMLCTCRYSSNTSTTSGETLELVKFDESKEPGCARENLDLLHMCQMQNSSCEKQICTCTGFYFKCTPYARWALLVECAAFTTALQLILRVSCQLQLHVRLIVTIIASGCNLAWRFSGGGMCPYMYFVLVYHTRGTNSPPTPTSPK